MFEKLPINLRFRGKIGGSIFMPGRITPTEVRGYGHLTLSFESTDRPELLSIGVRDLCFRGAPFSIPLDLDRDGQYECIELHDIELNMNHLNGEACRGTLNLQTGDMEIVFECVLSPKDIPFLERMGGQTVKFRATDRGRMDLQEGRFKIHAPVMRVKEWPFEGALLKGGFDLVAEVDGPDPEPDPESTVDMNVVIATPGARGCVDKWGKDITQKNIVICPGDEILLCWKSSADVVSVELDPGNMDFPATGTRSVTPDFREEGLLYQVTTIGGNTEARDSVEVYFYQGQWLDLIRAVPHPIDLARVDPDAGSWVGMVSDFSYSGQFEVQAVQLVLDACLDWERFLLEHFTFSGERDSWVEIESWDPVDIPVASRFRAPGTWKFTPQLDDPDRGRPTPEPREGGPSVCFHFRGHCLNGQG